MRSKVKVYRPLKAMRLNCLECSGGSFKSVLWCPCDGVHSTRCHLWPYRLGARPQTVVEQYGPALVTPEMMPGANVNEDTLPSGTSAAATYLSGQPVAAGVEARRPAEGQPEAQAGDRGALAQSHAMLLCRPRPPGAPIKVA